MVQTGFANSLSLCAVTNILDGDFPGIFPSDKFGNGERQRILKRVVSVQLKALINLKKRG